MHFTDDDLNAAAANAVDTRRLVTERAPRGTRGAGRGVAGETSAVPTGLHDGVIALAIALTLAMAFVTLGVSRPRVAGPFVALAAWVLAEHFTRQRRMALASLVLMLAFSGTVGWSVHEAVRTAIPEGSDGTLAIAAGSAASTGAGLAHWWRFRVPVTICALTLSGSYAVGVSLIAIFPALAADAAAMPLGIGCLLFGLGLWWDFRDTGARGAAQSAVAFWLHLAAAPMIVQPLITLLDLFGPGGIGTARPLCAVPIFAVLALIAVMIDRRAMLLAGFALVPPGVGLVSGAGAWNGEGVVVTGLVVGTGLTMLWIGWRTTRARVLRVLPRAARRVLPPAAAPSPVIP